MSAQLYNGFYTYSDKMFAISRTLQATPNFRNIIRKQKALSGKIISYKITSTLVRSLLISACDLITNVSTKKHPNSVSGQGIPRLNNVLPLNFSFHQRFWSISNIFIFMMCFWNNLIK